MPHQNLDAAEIGRLFQQMSGEAMPQGMGDMGFASCAASPACLQMVKTVSRVIGRSGILPGKSQSTGR